MNPSLPNLLSLALSLFNSHSLIKFSSLQVYHSTTPWRLLRALSPFPILIAPILVKFFLNQSFVLTKLPNPQSIKPLHKFTFLLGVKNQSSIRIHNFKFSRVVVELQRILVVFQFVLKQFGIKFNEFLHFASCFLINKFFIVSLDTIIYSFVSFIRILFILKYLYIGYNYI